MQTSFVPVILIFGKNFVLQLLLLSWIFNQSVWKKVNYFGDSSTCRRNIHISLELRHTLNNYNKSLVRSTLLPQTYVPVSTHLLSFPSKRFTEQANTKTKHCSKRRRIGILDSSPRIIILEHPAVTCVSVFSREKIESRVIKETLGQHYLYFLI